MAYPGHSADDLQEDEDEARAWIEAVTELQTKTVSDMSTLRGLVADEKAKMRTVEDKFSRLQQAWA